MVNKLACLDLKIVFKNKISHVGGTPELEPHGMPISKLQYVTVTVSVSHQDTFTNYPVATTCLSGMGSPSTRSRTQPRATPSPKDVPKPAILGSPGAVFPKKAAMDSVVFDGFWQSIRATEATGDKMGGSALIHLSDQFPRYPKCQSPYQATV
jgi:hypothetical protein